MLLFETSGSLIIAIGKTIIHSVWMGLIILAALRMVLLAISHRHSNQRYLVSVASLILLAASVLATFLLLYTPGIQAGSVFSVLEADRSIPHFLLMEPSSASSWEPNLLFTLCSYIYFAGMLFMVLRSLSSYSYIRKLKKSGRRVSGEWQDALKRISSLLGIKKEVCFLQSDQVTGPLIIGLLKPAVIVPVGMFTHLSLSQIETILIHELYHLKRLDYLVNIMQLFMEGVLFYNPAVWYISDRIRLEREHSCDDAVVKASNDPVNYAKALVQLAEHQQYIRLVPGAGGSSKNHFMTRIRRIINRNDMKKNMQERVMSLLLLAGAIMVLVVISGFSSGFSKIKQDDRIPENSAQHLSFVQVFPDNPVQDTIRDPKKQKELREEEEVDWDQIKEDMEAARMEAKEAMEEIDWDQIKEDMEAARLEAMEEIDWDEMKAEMDSAIQDMDIDFDMDFDMDVDMESIRENMEEARREMKEIDWEEMKQEMQRSFSEMQIDMEEMKQEIEESLEEIDWDEIKKDMENSRRDLDSKNNEKDI